MLVSTNNIACVCIVKIDHDRTIATRVLREGGARAQRRPDVRLTTHAVFFSYYYSNIDCECVFVCDVCVFVWTFTINHIVNSLGICVHRNGCPRLGIVG